MTALFLASITGYGVHLLYTARVLGWSGVGPSPKSSEPKRNRRSSAEWMTQAGLGSVGLGEFMIAISSMFLLGALLALALFGSPLPAITAGIFGASFPLAAYRQRRRNRLAIAQDAWPRMI